MIGAAVSTVEGPRPRQRSGAPASAEADQLLMRVAENGDRAAFDRLYAFFAPRLKAYLMRVGSTGEQAEDLAQEAMTRVWRKARLYDCEKASASTWIYTIARNLRIDSLRRIARPPLDPNEPAFALGAEPQADAEVERKERDLKIRQAFASLPPNQHVVVAMHFFDDEPHSAIAARLNLPLGTVKSRLRLAFARIRRELDEFK